jgi:uncharacterized small protein (DUF1192 family)
MENEMPDVYENVAQRIEALQMEVGLLKTQRDLALSTRDAAQAASNADLERRRVAEAKLAEARSALGFAASVIKSGEPWSNECEIIIGGALRD